VAGNRALGYGLSLDDVEKFLTVIKEESHLVRGVPA
jgi:hypothetical protein